MTPDEVSIETPEQVELTLEPAGLGARTVAWVVDALLKGLVLLGLALLGLLFAGLTGGDVSDWLSGYYLALVVAGVAVLLMAYDVYFEVWHNGQTPGKRHQGIRVLREGGGPVDFRSACIRWLLAVADFLPMFYLLGATLILLSRRRQRLGDLAAGTIVIRERTAAAPDYERIVGRLATEEDVFTPQELAGCTAGDRQVLRSFFHRYEEMQPGARRDLAARLAELFMGKTGHRPADAVVVGRRAEQYLAALYRDLETQLRHGR
jgi:uncharacterized RDD family membrane protein YckC